jgi:hypothetical protein
LLQFFSKGIDMHKLSLASSIGILFTFFLCLAQELEDPYVFHELSGENKAYVLSFMKQIGLDGIAIIQPSGAQKERNPRFFYEANFIPEYGSLFINEEWLNKLSDEEKRFFLGKALIKIKNEELHKQPGIFPAAFILAQLGATPLFYWYLGKTTTFKDTSRWKKILMTIGAFFLTEAVVNYARMILIRNKEEKLLFTNTKETIETFQCLEGGKAFYKRLEKELAPYKNTWPWRDYYRSLEKLIPYLEGLTIPNHA